MMKEYHTMYQHNEDNSLQNKEVEPFEPIQMKVYQKHTYRKNLSWLHFDDEPRVKERKQVNYLQSYISAFAIYLTLSTTSSNYVHQPRHDNKTPCKAVW